MFRRHFIRDEGATESETETPSPWPFRLKLTSDHLRWDSLKLSPSNEFKEHILANLDETSRNCLEAMKPIEIQIVDVDINETYQANLVKKDLFWFEPIPGMVSKKKSHSRSKTFPIAKCCYRPRAIDEEFSSDLRAVDSDEVCAYSVEPFKHIVKKRNLSYDYEIGLRWSETEPIVKYEFSVLYTPMIHRVQAHLQARDE